MQSNRISVSSTPCGLDSFWKFRRSGSLDCAECLQVVLRVDRSFPLGRLVLTDLTSAKG